MSTVRELQDRRAEITGLRDLLESASDDYFQRPLLRSKIAAREQQLAELENSPAITTPDTELLFTGDPVNGSFGIDAKFASVILGSFQDMVTNHHGGRLKPAMGGSGRRPGEQESRLYLTALPRGSFGLRLSQPNPEDFVAAQQIAEAMEQLTSLVDSAAANDVAFGQDVVQFHPRVLVPLGEFLKTIADRGATVTIRSGQRETILRPEQVSAARARVASTQSESETVSLRGIFRGVLLESLRFDFIPDGQSSISGALADSVSDNDAKDFARQCDRACTARLTKIRYRTHGNLSRPRYELVSLKPDQGSAS